MSARVWALLYRECEHFASVCFVIAITVVREPKPNSPFTDACVSASSCIRMGHTAVVCVPYRARVFQCIVRTSHNKRVTIVCERWIYTFCTLYIYVVCAIDWIDSCRLQQQSPVTFVSKKWIFFHIGRKSLLNELDRLRVRELDFKWTFLCRHRQPKKIIY